jgi:hypothetical protein
MKIIYRWLGEGMVDLRILEGLSFLGAERFLLESGYIEGECFKQESGECDAIVMYPYLLYDEDENVIDQVCHAEYCMIDEDGELEDFKSKWIRV